MLLTFSKPDPVKLRALDCELVRRQLQRIDDVRLQPEQQPQRREGQMHRHLHGISIELILAPLTIVWVVKRGFSALERRMSQSAYFILLVQGLTRSLA